MFSQRPVKPAKTIDNVYGSAFYHLEAKDRTINELRKKLIAKTDNQEWIDTVLNDLVERGYLKPDNDFAIKFVEMAFSSEKGSQFILSKLREKGINESIVNEAIAYVTNRDEIFFNFKTALIYIKKYDINNSFNDIIIMNHITHTQKHSSI
jgi:regulatory protein